MMSILRFTFFTIFLWCTHLEVFAQWREPQFVHLGPEEGLSSWTFNMTQDSTGYMYFGTDQGLVRYDGSSFTLFAHNPNDTSSIGPGDVWCVMAGTDQQIWIGTRLSGLNVFNPETLRFKSYPTPKRNTSDYDAVFALCEDHEENIWVGGQHFMLHRFNKTSAKFETFIPHWVDPTSGNHSGNITEILQDKLNPEILWLGIIDHHPQYKDKTRTGLVSFNTKTKIFEAFPCWGQPKHQMDNGQIWLSSSGINLFEPPTASCSHLPVTIDQTKSNNELNIRDILAINNKYGLCASKTIAFINEKGEKEFIKYDNDLGTVEDIFLDAQKNIWFGRTNGVSVLSHQEALISYYSLEEFGVTERIYPGRLAYNEGTNSLFVVDHAFHSTQQKIICIPLDSIHGTLILDNNTYVDGIAADQKGRLWVNSTGRLQSIDLENEQRILKDVDLPCIDQTPDFWYLSSKEDWIGGVSYEQFVWFNTDRNLCHTIDQNDLPLAKEADSSFGFQGMSFTKNEKAIVYSNEVFEVDLITGNTKKLHLEEGVNPYPKTEINSVIEDSRGHIWIATLAMTAEFKRHEDSLLLIKKYTTQDGLGCAWVHELYPDEEGRIWAFAQNGLNAIDPTLREVRQFGVKEGLADPYVDPRQVLTLNDGSIATTNGKGVIIFHPDALWNGYTPLNVKVVIKEIRISGKAIPVAGDVNGLSELSLKPSEDNIDFQFQGLAYPTDYNLNYSYKIEGLNEEWISIGKNKIVTLSSLSPGSYTLRIKAGSPSSPATEKTIKIYMATPIPQKPWFIVLSGLALLSFLLLGYRWRIMRIRHQEEEKVRVTKQMADLELKALRSQMNPHFMFNSLNSIKNYILQAKPNLAAEYLSNFSHLIRMILQNSGEKEISLQDELETLILYIELEQIRFEQKFEFNCVVEDGLRLEDIRIPPMILQPYVENAIWHGLMHKKEEGHLMLRFSKDKESEMVCCTIDDDGIGRKKSAEMKSLSATKYKSMGMGITKDRIDILNKMNALGIETEIIDKMDASGQAAGTSVIVKIPASNHNLLN